MAADLHFHLLPGVDDGPADMAESLELARAAVADGSSTVVATPHVRPPFVTDVTELRERVSELRAALDAAGVDLDVRRGGEIHHRMVGRLGQADLDSIAHGPPGARWLLLESPFAGIGEDFHSAADELRERGFGVVIAHPERSAGALPGGCNGLRRELAAGAAVQVNAMSLAGAHGESAERTARSLVKRGLASAVASDAHGPSRPPALGLARRAMVAHGVAPGIAEALVTRAPQALLGRGLRTSDALAA
jgi:protein-tyrosine phosphatase